MTLVQVLADETSVHMACDFRLSNPFTRQPTYNAAHKLITAQTVHGQALIGVTGVAFLDGKPIGDWIAETVGGFGTTRSIGDILDALRQGETAVARINGSNDRRITFMIGAFVGSQSLVGMVSNFQKFSDGRIISVATVQPVMTVSSIKPKAAVFFAAGDADSIQAPEREQLALVLRSGASDDKIHNHMRELNEKVSTRTTTVSPGCHTASLHATGSGSSRPFLTDEQPGDFIPPEFAQMMKRFGIQLNRKIGPDGKPMPIRMVQSASGRSGGSPEYFREQLKLRPESAEVWNNYGSFLSSRRQHDDAIAAFEKAHKLDPSYETGTANLAKQVWLQRGDIERASSLYREVTDASDHTAPAWIISDFAIFCDEALSDPDQALALHEQASQDENYPLASAHQALFLLKYKIDPSKARELLAFAQEKQPNNHQILRLAGQADFFYLQSPEAALEKLHKACSIDPNDPYLLRLTADICMETGDSASAAYYYRRLISRQEYDADVHGNYGLALLMEQKLTGAVRQLSEAARANPDNLTIQVNLAAALWVSGKQTEAVALMRSLLEAVPSPKVELELMAMIYVAVPASRTETVPRLRQLIVGGAQANGATVRCMVRKKSRNEREAGERVARIIESKEAIPPHW